MSDEGPEYDIETYRHALKDARRTHDQQLQAFNDIGEKAWRIVRLNGIIATVYIAAVANALQILTFSPLSAGLIIVGVGCLAVSALIAVIGQSEQSVFIGQSPDTLAQVREHDPQEIVYLYETLDTYESCIRQAHRRTEKNGKAVNVSKIIMLSGVGFITVGSLIAFVAL